MNLGRDPNTKSINGDKLQDNIMNMAADGGDEVGLTGFGRHGEYGGLQNYMEDSSPYYKMMNENQIYRNQRQMTHASRMIPLNNDSYFKFASSSPPSHYY